MNQVTLGESSHLSWPPIPDEADLPLGVIGGESEDTGENKL
jgi:hypothetical protein